jgi:histidine triad (HIT) family protein
MAIYFDPSCVFCKIIQNQLPSSKVWEDDRYLAFMSIAPINPGHVLVIPKEHIDYLFDLREEDLGNLMVVSKQIAQALKKAYNPQTGKIGVMIAGMEVHHAHIHLIPMNAESDLNFDRQKSGVPAEELNDNARRIRDELQVTPLPSQTQTSSVNLVPDQNS